MFDAILPIILGCVAVFMNKSFAKLATDCSAPIYKLLFSKAKVEKYLKSLYLNQRILGYIIGPIFIWVGLKKLINYLLN